ncbi:MAG: phosphopeptide-binding protein [Saprospiraceae bacterium]
MRFIILLFSFLFVFTACQDGTKTTESADKKEETKETPAPAKTTKYTLTPFEASTAYPDAKLESVSMKGGKIDFIVDGGSSYKLGQQTPDAPQKNCANSAKGQHIHVLIDDKPYAARYTASFDDLAIEPGERNILAFLSRSYHESIKTPDAYLAIKSVVHQNGSMLESSKITEPMVWYSRPKGTYTGKAATEKVMLDFYLVNTDLKNGNKVKAEINGEVHMIDNWQPYYIEGLPMGTNKITLSLLDKDGNLVQTKQNPISREFTLAEDVTEKM